MIGLGSSTFLEGRPRCYSSGLFAPTDLYASLFRGGKGRHDNYSRPRNQGPGSALRLYPTLQRHNVLHEDLDSTTIHADLSPAKISPVVLDSDGSRLHLLWVVSIQRNLDVPAHLRLLEPQDNRPALFKSAGRMVSCSASCCG